MIVFGIGFEEEGGIKYNFYVMVFLIGCMLVYIYRKDGNIKLGLEKIVLFLVTNMLCLKYLKENVK